MRTLAWPEIVEVSPGDSGFLSIAVTNTSSVIDAFEVQVFGLDPEWVEVEPARLSLFPGETANVAIELKLPEDYPASRRTLSVNVTSDDQPNSFALTQVALDIRPRTKTSITVDPTVITAGRSATFGLVVSNTGNAPVRATGFAVDPEDLAEFTFEPATVVVAPGREQVIEITAQGGRNWFGQHRARTFTLGVEPHGEDVVTAMGTFVQRPRISRWMLSLLGLLTAAAVFAFVLSRTFDRVVNEARVSTEVIDAALQSNQAGGAVVPTDPGSVKGQLVTLTTRQGLSGAQAELFVVDDTTNPVASAATDAEGVFNFDGLGAGTYLLRLSGSGVDSIWYGNVQSPADSTEIEVELDEPRDLGLIQIGGIPVQISGTIDVGDATGVTVSVVVPGQLNPDGSSVIATVPVGADGSFVLPDIPSPGVFQLVVEAPGFAPEVRDVVLAPGEELSGVEITLRPGNGLIEGTVSGVFGPEGGATVTATDGSNQIETVTLTEGAIGTFTLRDLATPGQYTVTISKNGYTREARVVALDPNQTGATIDVRLVPATGSIEGRALVNGIPARGVSVAISGGEVNRVTGVISQGPRAGTYGFFGLPAPGTYTLTFSGTGTIPQVRVIDIDPNTGTGSATGIDVSLSPERTTVSGVVRDVDGSPATQATITLSNGADDLTFLTANDPAGQFQFSNVAPGAYTLTARRTGTVEVTRLVNVSATNPTPVQDLQLGAQAGLTGLVTGLDPTARSVVVKLFLPQDLALGTNPIAITDTDANGRYTFMSLDAPQAYAVAVFDTRVTPNPLNVAVFSTQPGVTAAVSPIPIVLPS